MSQEYGFLVDLGKYSFDEGQPTWIQAFPLGKWTHPKYGEINVTPDKVARMASNVNANVRGQELDIDYDHKMHSGEAAGWVKGAEARPNGLWLAVQWTGEALTKLKDKAYKYFSPEYTDEWTNPVDGKVHKDVVFGGGITNRPFLKGILPINLTEMLADAPDTPKPGWNGKPHAFVPDSSDPTDCKICGLDKSNKIHNVKANEGDTLDPKQIRLLLKLAEDASDEDVTAKLTELMTPKEPVKPNVDPTVQVLAESNPVIKEMLDEMETLKAANRLSEVNVNLKELELEDADFALAPAVLSEARTIALEAPKVVGDKFLALLKEVRKNGIVDLREHGGRKPNAPGGSNDGESATKRFTEAVSKWSEEKKVPYAAAASQVAAAEPELFSEYRNESYLRERGQ